MMEKVHLHWYLWTVYERLPGTRKQKKKILSRVKDSIQEYVSENPNADFASIVKCFGTPEQFAESCVAEMDSSYLLEGMRTSEKILRIVMIAVTLGILIWVGFLTMAYCDFQKYENGYATVEIIEIEQSEGEK